jgi:hypothetical protein
MPIAWSTTANSDNVLLDYLQPLAGCLLLALPMCISIVLYTNHVREAAAMLAQVPLPEISATETIVPDERRGPAAMEHAAPIVQLQNPELSSSSRRNRQVIVAANQQDGPEYRGPLELARRAMGMNKQISRKLVPSSSSVRLTYSRGWSGADYPSHVKAALFWIWHHSTKRHSHAKAKSTRS